MGPRLRRWVLFSLIITASFTLADEGMWLYNAFPKDKVKAKYGFSPTQEWLDHIQLSSVRFNNGGSGSFVSANGLTFTNHHVAAECIQDLSTGGRDYLKNGFYAHSQQEEARCPNLELNQLIGIEDVTARVNAVAKPGMSSADAGQAQRAAMSAIEKDCAAATGLRCDVLTFYSGAVYHLYKYKKYTDVRLVFAPEFDAAFFGGDPDNFTWPRFDLDISFFRVYENDKPAHIQHYLRWSATGIKSGDLVFVSGNPGSTGRLKTMSQLEFLRDVDYPSRLERYAKRIAVLNDFSSKSEENARIAKEDLFGNQNSQKAFTGFEGGLKDKELMDRKPADEQTLRTAVASDSKQKAEIGDPWAAISHAMQVQKEIYPALTYIERRPRGYNSDLANIARDLVRVAEEKTKPNGERLREYRDSGLASLEQHLFSTAPIYKSLEIVLLAENLDEMQQGLGNDNPVVKKVLNGKTPEEVAKQLIEATKLDDVAVRKKLYEGGHAAIQASTDPLIVFIRSTDSEARAVRKRYEDEVESVERTEGAKIARAQFSEQGFTQPPDATFTLRLSYGQILYYITPKGEHMPFYESLGGAWVHAAKHRFKPPYQLPDSWVNAKGRINPAVALNFISTADIIGGSSGSPTVNKEGEVVGIIFDGNIESLPWNFVYDDKRGRAISVDARGIQEALRDIYGASSLADELLPIGPASPASNPSGKGENGAEGKPGALTVQ